MFENVKKIGRTFEKDGVLWLSYSGCGIGFSAEGNVNISLVGDRVYELADAGIHYARYAVYIDGAITSVSLLDSPERTHCYMAEGRHDYRLIKLSESNDSSLGISLLQADKVEPEPERRLRVEIVGNSITCGYGVEGDLSQTYTTATENVTKAWSYLTAAALEADYSIVSKSGAGIISGYTGDGVRNTDNIITGYYDLCGCSMPALPDGSHPADLPWKHEGDADLVLVNLGTNDISYCLPRDAEGRLLITEEESQARRRYFYAEYKNFISHIRSCQPGARIVCMLGVMGTALNPEIDLAVEELRMAGDSRIYRLDLPEQAEEDGRGTDYHPSELTQRKTADRVCAFIRSLT